MCHRTTLKLCKRNGSAVASQRQKRAHWANKEGGEEIKVARHAINGKRGGE